MPGKANNAPVEVDLFGGYKWGFAKDWALDLGLYRYYYPGTYDNTGAYKNPNTTEAYLVGLEKGASLFTQHHPLSQGFVAAA